MNLFGMAWYAILCHGAASYSLSSNDVKFDGIIGHDVACHAEFFQHYMEWFGIVRRGAA
jgi:hypothetical protein